MVFEEVISKLPPEIIEEFSKNLETTIVWIKTLGILLVVWVIFEIVSLIISIKKLRRMKEIQNRLKALEEKIELLTKRKK